MKQSNSTPTTNALEALQSRFALRLASQLSERSNHLDRDVSERLRFAREQALSRAKTARTAETVSSITGSRSGAVTLGRNGWGWWQRIGAFAPALALVAGLVGIQEWHDNTQITVAAEIDAALLSDDLPPKAYSDVGFSEFLRTSHE